MAKFTRAQLPILGWCMVFFKTKREAESFARWAVKTTQYDQYPCNAAVVIDKSRPAGEQYGVEVNNW